MTRKVALVPDHLPQQGYCRRPAGKKTRDFARKMKVHYFEVGKVGIEHALLPEGLIKPGMW